ncbi:MAG: TetR/AcrR family transcriptional regulator [Actinomycetota bacterium]
MKPRRSNQERTAATRAAILNATIEQLAEHGYGRTTTVEVAERAGVSRGALVHHFSTRSDLVLSALEYLCERRLEELEAGIAALSATEDRVSAFVDLIWSTFEGPLFVAQLELWMAARTDPELFALLLPLERGFGKRLSELCVEALGEGASGFYELTKHLMRGMGLERLLKADEHDRLDVLERWKAMADVLR